MEYFRKIVIGIDPDKAKSGIGIVRIREGAFGLSQAQVEADTLAFPALVSRIRTLYLDIEMQNKRERDWAAYSRNPTEPELTKLEIWVEAGWLEKKSNHHGLQGRRAEKIAKDVGANHQTGRLIIEMLDSMGIEAREAQPLVKCWKGSDRKITHEELDRIVGGMPGRRSNQEERDALLLAWVRSGLPIRC